jgi:hypothetical protein
MKAALVVSIGLAALVLVAPATAEVNVTTYHNDNMRTGWNPNETVLTQSNLDFFAWLKTVSLDEQVDAEPLIVSNETINGVQHNVVYVATEGNTVYGLDSVSGKVLAETNLGAPVPQRELPGLCTNNSTEVGIDSTPVIDTNTGAMYLINHVLQGGVQTYYLHALSLTTLQDLVAPELISASGVLNDGSVYQFNPAVSRQRAALLLANGNIYAGFGSFCDLSANLSRGWVLGWQESTLAPLASNRLNNLQSKSPNDFFLSSVWMSGYGLAANAAGSIFFVTGNSDYSGRTFNKKTNIAESAVEMSADLSTIENRYTPANHAELDKRDLDFGSGGLMLLPPQQGISSDLAAAAGKDGNLYLLDADNLATGYGSYPVTQCWCGPSYYQDSDGLGRIVTSGGHTLMVWAVQAGNNGGAQLQKYGQYDQIANGQDGGFFTSVSSNGTEPGTAVVWAVGRPVKKGSTEVSLYAINPDNQQLLFTGIAGLWSHTGGNSNIVPMVANGYVYVASDKYLTIFGLGGAKKKMGLPPVRIADAPLPLSPGEHEVYGIVQGMNGDALTILRDGKTVGIDTTIAKRVFAFAPPSPGHAVLARGRYNKSGELDADTVEHAVDNPAMWPSNR